jgi:hypothetical protein
MAKRRKSDDPGKLLAEIRALKRAVNALLKKSEQEHRETLRQLGRHHHNGVRHKKVL